jgi:UDP:flavonoid glycosyltransferase YjiC (YdhE family)
MQAAVARRGMKLVWIRRGMWRASQSNDEFLTRAACFDLIIEPGDIAADFDGTRGRLTAGGCLKLPPIGLLDERELLDREAARQALGLDPGEQRTSVLVQLGSGTTRDLNRLLDRVFEILSGIDGLEIVLAQWLNATSESRGVWPGVKILQGYPIPLYYRAFDFTISAAGYNSFNDLLRFGVPTIFIANDAQIMDDQGARARYAQEAQAAFDINEFELEPLGDCVAAIMQPNVRDYLAQRARKLARPNGAGRAVRAIAGLLKPGGARDVAGGRH